MKLEVLLSVMNLNKKNLKKMNITSKCIVINQCNKNSFEKYKNFDIYSYNEIGVSNSRNHALDHAKEDILLFCDDDVVYNKDYEELVLEEFENNKKADAIIFNFESPNRRKKKIKRRKRLHIYNSFRYATYDIAVRKESIKSIYFNTLFGPNAKYNNGSDTLFITDLYKNKLRVYSSPKKLGIAYNEKSTWFKGYNEKYFFNKGALYTAVSFKFRYILMLQYLIRHKEVLQKIKFIDAYKLMLKGSKDYINYKEV